MVPWLCFLPSKPVSDMQCPGLEVFRGRGALELDSTMADSVGE